MWLLEFRARMPLLIRFLIVTHTGMELDHGFAPCESMEASCVHIGGWHWFKTALLLLYSCSMAVLRNLMNVVAIGFCSVGCSTSGLGGSHSADIIEPACPSTM